MFRSLIIFVVLLVTSCANSQSVTIPRPPTWPAGELRKFTSVDVRNVISQQLPGTVVDLTDATFIEVDHDWLLRMVDWSDIFLKITSHRYTKESFDCDKFAKAFTLGVEWVAGDSGVQAQPLVARVFVNQVESFGTVPSGGRHALIGFKSNKGYFILEPQAVGLVTRLRLVPLEKYPNKIYAIKIGG